MLAAQIVMDLEKDEDIEEGCQNAAMEQVIDTLERCMPDLITKEEPSPEFRSTGASLRRDSPPNSICANH